MNPVQSASIPYADNGDHFVISLIENRAKEVGIAAFDFRTASLHLNQFIESSRSYQNTTTLLQFFSPKEILFPSNLLIPFKSNVGISTIINNSKFSGAEKISLPRSHFNDVNGALLLQAYAMKETKGINIESYHKQYYLCLGATSALLKWIENDRGIFLANNSISVTFNCSFDHLAIDATSIESLEIMESLSPNTSKSKQRKGSLFGILNSTKTSAGERLLKANLLQPLKDISTISIRLDCLEELTTSEGLFLSLSQAIQKFPKDFDKIISTFVLRPKLATEDHIDSSSSKRSQAIVSAIIVLKEAIYALPDFDKALSKGKCVLLQDIKNSVCSHSSFKTLKEKIELVVDEEVIHARAPFIARTQQCFAVRAGVDGFLDVARKTFCETSEAIHALGKAYREELNLPNLKLPYKSRRGFFISIPVGDIQEKGIPSIFQQLNMRNNEASNECFSRSLFCLEDLCGFVRNHLSLIAVLSESISLLDMLVNSFAFFISTKEPGSYVRPEFTENGPLAIDGGRHPVVEELLEEEFVANSTFLSEASNLMVITGPNMSGKSTYLRQVALIVIMAHIGMFVPAKFVSLKVLDRIFTRLGTGDNLEANSSTFMTEMREIAFIVQNMTSRSLVIVDELGRATSTLDGLSIAWSCSEYFLAREAFVLFATHMQRMSELSSIYPNTKICYFSVQLENNRLKFLYSLKEGLTDIPNYGILLAEHAGFPQSIITEAKRISEAYDEGETRRLEVGYSKYASLRKDYQVAQRLFCLENANLNEEDLRKYLQNLKEGYLDGTL